MCFAFISFFRFDHDTTVSESHQCFPVHEYRLLRLLRDTLMMGFGQRIGILFVIRSLAGRKEGVFYYGPKGYKNGMLGNQQIFEHQSTGKEAKDKKRVLPVILQCVLCYAAKPKKGGEVAVAVASTKSMSGITLSKGRPRIASRLDTKKY